MKFRNIKKKFINKTKFLLYFLGNLNSYIIAQYLILLLYYDNYDLVMSYRKFLLLINKNF